eukprot:g4462.t1
MGQDMPVRIDLFDDDIESIRHFDADTQLTVEKVSSLEILPGREFSLTREAIHQFQNRAVLAELLERDGLSAEPFDNWQDFKNSTSELGISIAPIEQGFQFNGQDFALITEAELLNEKVRQQTPKGESKRWVDADQVIRNLTELRIGAPVVHIEHGVGRYLGLITLKTDGQANEFLHLEYAGNNKLYVPVTSLNLISRYSGADADSAPLNKLGSDQWEKAKRKAREQIRDTAAELLDIYARRMAKPGHAFTDNEADYTRFCEEFPFEETEDQLTCIAAVREDMLTPRAMDRLVCGDVGFGKTEVAMRAAFTAASSGKQVMMLVPTTLLARQHYDSFRDRFANWPVKIDSVSRLKSSKEQDRVLASFQNGDLDILIGTHKLLGQKPDSTRLGLLIVDEEHRFGVRQKEQLKSLKAEVDILTLTATPIPRTLNMAMASIRDLSIIATPPAKRLMVKTFVRPYEKAIVREAIQRELLRGGQVFYLHNEVRSIERCAEEMRELVPNARIGVAHGQMRERDLEATISDFYHHRYDILICSTIVETGIDIPNANTMLIERADKFGLAQLHQLRGRVGRSHHQAYAYLLTPDAKSMTSDAEKRLDAIEAADHLGSGFTLATHDLEIRGAGELLGDNQSGQIHAIGFDLYQQMLESAVKSLQSGNKEANVDLQEQSVEANLKASALIPEDYLPDVNSRLQLYKRIANTATEAELRDLQVEMIDRYGLLPAQGYFFAKPEVVAGKAIAANQTQSLQLLAELQKEDVEVDTVQQIISRDVALSYGILKLINSAAFGLSSKVESIQAAVSYIGLKPLTRWITLLVITNSEDQNSELLSLAIVRARMCELLSAKARIGDGSAYFTAGLFSMLEAIMQVPITEIIEKLPLSDELVAALIDSEGPMGEAIECAQAYEECEWDKAHFLNLDVNDIVDIYTESVNWANETISLI